MRAKEFITILESTLVTDVPREEWLQGKIDYAKSKGRDSYGVPYMGSTTGVVRPDIKLPVSILKRLPGMRGEQRNVRDKDLQAIIKIMRDTGKLPLRQNGEEYAPFVMVAYNGEAWVNEGNHRIMAAAALGWDELPVELKYFDGGERIKSGPLYPGKIGLGDPIYEDEIEEADYRSKEGRFIYQGLRNAGYKKLGHGADATVWAKDDDHVIKIVMPETTDYYYRDLAIKSFMKFYHFVERRSENPALPKFLERDGSKSFHFKLGDKEFKQFNIEKLYPIKKNSFEELMVWMLSDYVTHNMTWGEVVKDMINDPKSFMSEVGKKRGAEMHQRVKNWVENPNEMESYKNLYLMMKALLREGRLNKYGWDLHTANVMQRKDGTLVITDPWFTG